ncbi:MAG: aspartate aminotransferase family protein [Acidobacteriota bacterium]
MNDIIEKGKRFLTPALTWDYDICVTKGEGVFVWDSEDRKYLDFTSGTAVLNIGHRPPKVVEAAKRQIDNLIHSGGNYYYKPIIKLAEELGKITPGKIDTFFFSNAGTEVIEGAVKLARYVTKRHGIIVFQGAFHGRTMGAVSFTTSNIKYRRHYFPMLPSVFVVPYPYCFRSPFSDEEGCIRYSINSIEELFFHQIPPDEVAAILIEPIQGEGGYIIPPKKFMKELRELTSKHGIMLIFDEIQTGVGRTGKWFASEHFEVVPDIITIAKAIASGFPLSVLGAPRDIMDKWPPGAHGTTFGGNPVSCAAALATIETIQEENLLDHAIAMGDIAKQRFYDLQQKYDVIGDIRGLGLMIGIEFVMDGKRPNPEVLTKLLQKCMERGLLMIRCGTFGNVLRFIPPIIVKREELDYALDIIEESISKAM